ncbi:MAG: glycosyltransferase [Acidobacteriota bacterium]
MRIAQLIHGLGLGGAQQVIRSLVAGRSDGFEHIVYSCHGGVMAERIAAAGATVRIVPRRVPKLDPLWIRDLGRALRRDRIDAVHGHLFGDSLHGYVAAARSGLTPMVMTLHNITAARSRLQLTGYRWLLGRETLPVACADFVRRSFVDTLGSRAQEIRTVRNGIEEPAPVDAVDVRAELSSLFGLPPDAVVLATLGRLAEQKGLDRLLKAFAHVADRVDAAPSRLVVFGDGPLRAELEAAAQRFGLGRHVVFAGYRDDAARLLAGVDAVVFSSLWEGLPIAMLEAMAASRPVVSTAVGGVPEAIDDGVEGLLVARDDIVGLSEALERIVDDVALRRRRGRAARRRFEGELHARHMVTRYETLYHRVLKRRARAA